MGFFDFLPGVGRKEEDDPQWERTKEMSKANRIKRFLFGLELPIENLKVDYRDGTVILEGEAASQADREKAILACGNTEGVSRVDDRITVAAPEDPATFYTVRKGDSLSKIAKAHYGDAMKYPLIFEANKPMLSDPNLIYPGQVLRIPAAT